MMVFNGIALKQQQTRDGSIARFNGSVPRHYFLLGRSNKQTWYLQDRGIPAAGQHIGRIFNLRIGHPSYHWMY